MSRGVSDQCAVISEPCFTARQLEAAVHAESCHALSDSQVNILLLCGHRFVEGVPMAWMVIKGRDPEQLQEDVRMLSGWVEVRDCHCWLTGAGQDFLKRAWARAMKGDSA